jgi:starch phosphorylase
MHLYLRIVEDDITPASPRTCIFAGKAAPGYFEAKEIIHLIHRVARVVNADPKADPWLKVAFLPDYRVTLAEKIIPAADLSEQISTAGTEASGTGNMKFGLNGALTIGTLDGANIEMLEEVGEENIYIFGLKTPEVADLLSRGAYNPWEALPGTPGLGRVLEALAGERFTPGEPGLFRWLHDRLLAMNERYCHLADFGDYARTQARVEADYARPEVWRKKAVLNTARMGQFSSDRTIREYARDIWNIAPVPPTGNAAPKTPRASDTPKAPGKTEAPKTPTAKKPSKSGKGRKG